MLDQTTRTAILRLRDEGHGSRAIADALGLSRGAVKRVLRGGTAEVPRLIRNELGEPHREQIVELYATTRGNLVRVHEELGVPADAGLAVGLRRGHRVKYDKEIEA